CGGRRGGEHRQRERHRQSAHPPPRRSEQPPRGSRPRVWKEHAWNFPFRLEWQVCNTRPAPGFDAVMEWRGRSPSHREYVLTLEICDGSRREGIHFRRKTLFRVAKEWTARHKSVLPQKKRAAAFPSREPPT